MSVYETKRTLDQIAQANAAVEAQRAAVESEFPLPAFRCFELSAGATRMVAWACLGGPDPTGVIIQVVAMHLRPVEAVALGRWLISTAEYG